MAANPVAAVVELLKADAEVERLTDGRVWAAELPESENQSMPRAAVVINAEGGRGSGAGARSYAPWANVRIDVYCYGETRYAADELDWAVYGVLTQVRRTEIAETLVHDLVSTAGPLSDRASDTDWPYTLSSFDVAVGLPGG